MRTRRERDLLNLYHKKKKQYFFDVVAEVDAWLEDQGLDVGALIDDVERALDEQLETQELDEVIQDMERLAEASSEAVAEQVREILAYLKA